VDPKRRENEQVWPGNRLGEWRKPQSVQPIPGLGLEIGDSRKRRWLFAALLTHFYEELSSLI
jgi:hypothetical protein